MSDNDTVQWSKIQVALTELASTDKMIIQLVEKMDRRMDVVEKSQVDDRREIYETLQKDRETMIEKFELAMKPDKNFWLAIIIGVCGMLGTLWFTVKEPLDQRMSALDTSLRGHVAEANHPWGVIGLADANKAAIASLDRVMSEKISSLRNEIRHELDVRKEYFDAQTKHNRADIDRIDLRGSEVHHGRRYFQTND